MADAPLTLRELRAIPVTRLAGVGDQLATRLSEIGIDIVSLGLVYDTNIDDDGLLTIDMTLTTPYCPLGPVIETQAHAVCAHRVDVRIGGATKVVAAVYFKGERSSFAVVDDQGVAIAEKP